MIPTKKQIRSEIKKLRIIVDSSGDDYVLARIAYSMECMLRWAIEDTEAWDLPHVEAIQEAEILKSELKAHK